ncbi:uncharacterized protein LOC119210665 isoform X1 [Tachysurus ichikawai]
MVSSSLSGVKLQYVNSDDFQSYDTLLMPPLKTIPGTRKNHQVVAKGNIIHCRNISCFCNEPQICQCFSPVTHTLDGIPQDPDEGPRQNPLAMLMEAMEKEPNRELEGITTGIGSDDTQSGDWLVVTYEQNWWLAKALTIDQEHQGVQVEFFHPHGPNHQGDIYSNISAEVMDFIEEEHLNRLLPGV